MGFQIKAWVIFGHSQLVYFAAFVKVLGLFSGIILLELSKGSS
jgi:hypothetical protein